ncbi:MAG: hypothetical protein EON94_05760 [Caulobacteraceae bacterium]|nr:MAG: hypothetical protein EON94_05760 [Caulobacteraceae bacterium]
MSPAAILEPALWAGLFAIGLAAMLTAPVRYLLPSFFCAFIGRAVRDILTDQGMSVNWATVLAATAVVLVAVLLTRRNMVSPVVLICGVLPLGAAVAMFNLIFALMQLSTAKADALNEASLALGANVGKVFVTSLAIALGLGAGLAICRLFKRDDVAEV